MGCPFLIEIRPLRVGQPSQLPIYDCLCDYQFVVAR
jgi:hypothetical protein